MKTVENRSLTPSFPSLPQTPSLRDADPRSNRFLYGGHESKFPAKSPPTTKASL